LVYRSLFTIKLLYSFLCIFNELCTVFRNIISMINNTLLTHKQNKGYILWKEYKGFEFMIFVVMAGPATCSTDPQIDCTGHGQCVQCKETCIRQGFKKGGACLGFEVCCCLKGWKENYTVFFSRAEILIKKIFLIINVLFFITVFFKTSVTFIKGYRLIMAEYVRKNSHMALHFLLFCLKV